jgi:hypothetical protein
MGTSYVFTCQSCDYSAEVSGGRDFGFTAVVQTMVCRDCAKWVDVLIGYQGEDGPTGDPEYYKAMKICPYCKGKNLEEWNSDLSCPKCSGPMQTSMGVLWD